MHVTKVLQFHSGSFECSGRNS